MEKPLGLNALAAAVRLPRDWLLVQASAGRIPCLRVGRRLLFNLSAVQAAIADLAASSRLPGEAVRCPQ